eukprot:TRINITY_DN44513_c0_g1_i1.p2 TRINITY_DN44513_c0_g1~~TRINITY_DN44513_c0_g1_i1.p2  ORF type:complete len:115 (+),score=10.52 TRINITY_DN44513_c0_g1_i1:702-1046(+)
MPQTPSSKLSYAVATRAPLLNVGRRRLEAVRISRQADAFPRKFPRFETPPEEAWFQRSPLSSRKSSLALSSHDLRNIYWIADRAKLFQRCCWMVVCQQVRSILSEEVHGDHGFS